MADSDTTALEYLDVPPAATFLQATASSPTNSLLGRPALRQTMTPPQSSSPPLSPTTTAAASYAWPSKESTHRSNSLGLGSPSLSAFPQFLFSAALPGGISASSTPNIHDASPGGSGPTGGSRRRTASQPVQPLTSTKDPLSLPLMSVNFKRFVTCVGPVFWLQDRIEEIVLWKKGWVVTAVWLCVYGFLCYFPQLLLCLPHIVLISVILSTYPYPYPSSKDIPGGSLGGSASPAGTAATAGTTSDTSTPAEGSVPWQTNLQSIQNLMGTISDFMDLAKPYTFHFRLTPAHISLSELNIPPPPPPPSLNTVRSRQNSLLSTSGQPQPPAGDSTQRRATATTATPLDTRVSSPYTVHLLTLLVVTFPPLVYVVSLPQFPLRFVFFLAGALPILASHPSLRDDSLTVIGALSLQAWSRPIPEPVWSGLEEVRRRGRWWKQLVLTRKTRQDQDEEGQKMFGISKHAAFKTIAQRVIDNDRLADECWASEMKEVELWENERYAGVLLPPEPTIGVIRPPSILSRKSSKSTLASLANASFASLASVSPRGKGTWSKSNLRPNERGPWTRRRDGWNGITSGGAEEDHEGGSVDSRLTFPLAAGWSFVQTEDWRRDITAEWAVGACGGGDEDGWVYTNDVWQDPQSSALGANEGAGGPYVTRRRRWVRRIWFNSRTTARTYGS